MKYMAAIMMQNESMVNIADVTLEASFTLIFSVIKMYPTNTRPPIPIPSMNIRKSVKFKLFETSIREADIKSIMFPKSAIFFLPCLSLILGRIKLPIATPAKKNEPNLPKTDFGAQVRSNLYTQL